MESKWQEKVRKMEETKVMDEEEKQKLESENDHLRHSNAYLEEIVTLLKEQKEEEKENEKGRMKKGGRTMRREESDLARETTDLEEGKRSLKDMVTKGSVREMTRGSKKGVEQKKKKSFFILDIAYWMFGLYIHIIMFILYQLRIFGVKKYERQAKM